MLNPQFAPNRASPCSFLPFAAVYGRNVMRPYVMGINGVRRHYVASVFLKIIRKARRCRELRTHTIGVRTRHSVNNSRRCRETVGVACYAPTEAPFGNLSNRMAGVCRGAACNALAAKRRMILRGRSVRGPTRTAVRATSGSKGGSTRTHHVASVQNADPHSPVGV